MSSFFSNEFSLIKYIIELSLMHLYYFVNYFTANSKSPLISTLVAPRSNKIVRPAIKASYSVSLVEQQPLDLNLYLVSIPWGD